MGDPEVSRVDQKLTVDIQVVFSPDFRSLINGVTTPIEDTTQHVFRDG